MELIDVIICDNCRYFSNFRFCEIQKKNVRPYYRCEDFQFTDELKPAWERFVNETLLEPIEYGFCE